jgi:polyphosphate kinase
MFPVESMELKNKLIMVLDAVFRDNFNARQLSADGSYARILPAKEEDYFSSQRYFREEANKEFEQKEKARDEKRKQIFQPLTNPVDEFFKKDEVNDEDENG